MTKIIKVDSCGKCSYCDTNTDNIPAYCLHDDLYDTRVPYNSIHRDCPLPDVPDVKQIAVDFLKYAGLTYVDDSLDKLFDDWWQENKGSMEVSDEL